MIRLVCTIVLLATPVLAQQAPTAAMTSTPMEYPKSKAIAVGLEIVVPILGHGYAGDAKKGILPAIVTLGGYIAIGTTLDDEGEIKGDKEGTAALGAVAVLAGRAWALVQVSKMVDAHNKNLTVKPLESDRLGAKIVFTF